MQKRGSKRNQGAPGEGAHRRGDNTVQKVKVLRTKPAEPLGFKGLQQGQS